MNLHVAWSEDTVICFNTESDIFTVSTVKMLWKAMSCQPALIVFCNWHFFFLFSAIVGVQIWSPWSSPWRRVLCLTSRSPWVVVQPQPPAHKTTRHPSHTAAHNEINTPPSQTVTTHRVPLNHLQPLWVYVILVESIKTVCTYYNEAAGILTVNHSVWFFYDQSLRYPCQLQIGVAKTSSN